MPVLLMASCQEPLPEVFSVVNVKLTKREMQIAELCAKGIINKEIADILGVSQRTVETHKNNIYKKLGINNTIELVRYMQRVFDKEK